MYVHVYIDLYTQWEELMARRPEKGEEDPEEAALVEQFKENMGDYKLKTASDYVVPKHQRATFSKKKRSLIFLRNQVDKHSLIVSLYTHSHIVIVRYLNIRGNITGN